MNIILTPESLGVASLIIYGDMFDYYTGKGLYLSGNSPLLSSSRVDFYSTTKSLSTNFPAFSGIPLEYSVISNNEISFKTPTYLPQGDYDLIFCNPAGYAKVSNARKNYKIIVTEFEPLSVALFQSGDILVTMNNNNIHIETIKKYLDV